MSQSCKILLRHDQNSSQIGAHADPGISIYAPKWVEEGLELLGQRLKGTSFEIFEGKNLSHGYEKFTLGHRLTITQLQKISRNEERNVSGSLNSSLYASGNLDDWEILLAMKDLCRQSVIVGRDYAFSYGGFPAGTLRVPLDPHAPTYIVDLAGLQFQQYYNTGRLVLIEKEDHQTGSLERHKKGLLDELIFERVVGEKKASYDHALNSSKLDSRYLKVPGFFTNPTLFDVEAYHKFVAWDVVITGLALADTALANGEHVNFKFLKYGTGYFAGRYREQTNSNILQGVVLGLELLFRNFESRVKYVLRHVEFPYYNPELDCTERLEMLKKKYGFGYNFSREDALKPTQRALRSGVTNCGDSTVVIGNEMGFGSVDAAMIENIVSKGSIFCPILNPSIKEHFVEIPPAT